MSSVQQGRKNLLFVFFCIGFSLILSFVPEYHFAGPLHHALTDHTRFLTQMHFQNSVEGVAYEMNQFSFEKGGILLELILLGFGAYLYVQGMRKTGFALFTAGIFLLLGPFAVETNYPNWIGVHKTEQKILVGPTPTVLQASALAAKASHKPLTLQQRQDLTVDLQWIAKHPKEIWLPHTDHEISTNKVEYQLGISLPKTDWTPLALRYAKNIAQSQQVQSEKTRWFSALFGVIGCVILWTVLVEYRQRKARNILARD